jgi:ferredoxin-like protein FixX
LGLFIEVKVDDPKLAGAEQRQALVASCPVDIFVLADGQVESDPAQEDECILCGACLAAAPSGAVSIKRLYGRKRPLEIGA